ncbi:hypothetical protein MP228_008909 [Amoeboaphelidium protococcarum]|nr:hypothetical protein MP228_008909 [Amoeboaphelidium protococcarum]
MKRKFEESQSELFDQILDLPDSTLSSYLRPKDLFQLSMSCMSMDLFIKTDRQFVRNCYWKYYGPCLTSLRIINHYYLGLQSVEDYAYFMVEDVADYGCLREFVHYIKSGLISDYTAERLCLQNIDPNWVEAISKHLGSSQSYGFGKVPRFGNEVYSSQMYQYPQRKIQDEMEVLSLNNLDYALTFLRDFDSNYADLEAGQIRQLYCSKFGIFEEAMLTKGLEQIFNESRHYQQCQKLDEELFDWDYENQDANQLRYSPFKFLEYYGADQCATFRTRLVKYMERSPDLNVKYQCAIFLIDSGNITIEECARMLAQQVATAVLADDVEDDEFGILGADQLEGGWNQDMNRNIDQEVDGLTQLGTKVLNLILQQFFKDLVLPALRECVSQSKRISLLTAALQHYGMLRQDSNELYCILVRQLIRNKFGNARSIIACMTDIRTTVNFYFAAVNDALWVDNQTRLSHGLKVLIEDYLSNYDNCLNIYNLITISILFRQLLYQEGDWFYQKSLKSLSSYFATVGGLFDTNKKYRSLSYIEHRYMNLKLGHPRKRATAVQYATILISDLFDMYPEPLVVIEKFFWQLLLEEKCGCNGSFIAALLDFIRQIDYQLSEDMAVIAAQHFGQNSESNLVLMMRELQELNFMSDAVSETVWEYCTKEQIFENIITYQGKRVQRDIAYRIEAFFAKKQND